MVRKWLVALPLLAVLSRVFLQPITNDETVRRVRQMDPRDCCPCPDSGGLLPSARSAASPVNCSCSPRADDAEASASILLPALRAIQPFVNQADTKPEPKPLLQPEVGLASSVLETLRQATDEEYQEALARDAARSAIQLIESTLDPPDDDLTESPNNIVRIFLNPKGDDMDDNLPEPSHVQETRCIHSPLQSIHKNGQLRISNPSLEGVYKKEKQQLSRPSPFIEVIDLPRKPVRKLENKGLLHRNFNSKDSGFGASNIQERILKPNLDNNLENFKLKSNPSLFSILTKSDDHSTEGLENNINDGLTKLNQNANSKINTKLKDLIDSLAVNSKKEKPKLSAIDLKSYFSTTTRIPPTKFKSIEKSTYKPLLLKDLLKLKDVELIPRKQLTMKPTTENPSYSNLKLRSEISRINIGSDNCEESSSNLSPHINNNIPVSGNAFSSEMIDTVISPSNSNPVYESKNILVDSVQQDKEPAADISNRDINFTPPDLEDQNIHFSGVESNNFNDNSKKEQLFLDNCDNPTDVKNVVTNKFSSQRQNLKNNNVLNGDSNHNEFKIELVEDLDLPVEFDNSSFIPKSESKNFENPQSNIIDNLQNTSNYPIIQNHLQTNEHVSDSFNDLQANSNAAHHECISESFSPNFDSLSESQTTMQNEERNSMEEECPEEKMNVLSNINTHEATSDINQEPIPISFDDLQDMSNSILNLSECEPPTDEKEVIRSDLNEINDECDTSYMPFEPIVEDKLENSPTSSESLNSKSGLDEESDLTSQENICDIEIANETSNSINNKQMTPSLNMGTVNPEMIAEASMPESTVASKILKTDIPTASLFQKIDNDIKNMRIFTKPTTDLSNVVRDKHTDFLNSLQSKLGSLFTTTEKTVDVSSIPDDNANESSNIKPKTAIFENIQLQRSPQTLLRENLVPKLPSTPLSSYKNKLAAPKYLDLPFRSNQPRVNFLNIPGEMTGPFDETLNPNFVFTDFSDSLRTHAENTIQNVKETLESTLKDSQNIRLNRPTNIVDTQDLIENLSNKRDEMKEKLEAIHLDLNDRFSSFHQNIVDHFNQLPNINSENNRKGGLRKSYIPARKELVQTEASNVRNVKAKQNNLKSGARNDLMKPTNIPKVSDKPRLGSTNKNLPVQIPVTTAIPSFVPRSKLLKTNIDASPKLNSKTLSHANKVANLLKEKNTKSVGGGKVSEDPFTFKYGSPLKSNIPVKFLKANIDKTNGDDLSRNSPVNNFRKSLLQRNNNQNFSNDLRKNLPSVGFGRKTLESDEDVNTNRETLSSRIKEGRLQFGSKTSNEMFFSPTSHTDAIQPNDNDGLRIVEPMKENVPYKCKLICYKD